MKNQFESLRKEGIAGQVQTSGCNTVSLVNTAKVSIQMITASLLPGVWDYGFHVSVNADSSHKLPGEGSGWFKSEKDAKLYCLGEFRNMFASDRDICQLIDAKIYELRNETIFGF